MFLSFKESRRISQSQLEKLVFQVVSYFFLCLMSTGLLSIEMKFLGN